MIGLTFWAVALAAGALSESPSRDKGATSYSVYHRKFEPSEGHPRSVSYSTKVGPRISSPRGESFGKDSPTSFVKGAGSSKDTSSYTGGGSSYSDGLNYKSGSSYSSDGPPSKGSYSSDGPPPKGSYSNDGPPPKGSYSNDGPSYSKGSSPPNYSGENYKDDYDGFSPSTPSYSNDGPSYDAAPHSNNPPPVYDTPNPPQDVPYNGPSYVPPPPVNAPQYDGPPVAPPFVNGGSSFPVNVPSQNIPSFSPSHSNFPVNVPNVGNYQNFPSNVGNYQNFPSNVPNYQNFPSNVGNYQNFPGNGANYPNIPNVGNFQNIPNVGNFNIPKPSFSLPFINPSVPGQFSYPIDRSGTQFSSPLKVYHQSVPLQQPLLLASAKVPIILRPSYQSPGSQLPGASYSQQYR